MSARTVGHCHVGMTNILHVLCVGSENSCNTIRDAVLVTGHCRLSTAKDCRDLFAVPKRESFEIAILHHSLSLRDFRDSSEYIRRTWPDAKILAICVNPEVLDDPLYDDWIAPSRSLNALIATIERLSVGRREQ